jgi:hypothetical protein
MLAYKCGSTSVRPLVVFIESNASHPGPVAQRIDGGIVGNAGDELVSEGVQVVVPSAGRKIWQKQR